MITVRKTRRPQKQPQTDQAIWKAHVVSHIQSDLAECTELAMKDTVFRIILLL